MREITKIIVHCSATPPSMVNVDVKTIDVWHRERGFTCCGYHYVIKRDGTVQEGRAETAVGAHCAGYNAESIGVCLIGGTAEDKRTPECNYTDAQYAALAALLAQLQSRFKGACLLGHNELDPHKTCPNFDVKKWYSEQGKELL